MKILHVTPAFSPAFGYGGPIPVLHSLCLHLAEAGCSIRVLTTNTNGLRSTLDVSTRGDIQIADQVHVRYCRRIARHSVSIQLLRALPRYIGWSDAVHLTGVYNFPVIPTLLLCRLMDKPVMWSPHGVLQRWEGSRRKRLKNMWERICWAVTPKRVTFHASSQVEADELRRFVKALPIAVIPWGVTIPQHVHKTSKNGVLRVLYLGRLDPKKGIENLIDACKLLAACGDPDWSLTIAGAGDSEYTQRLARKIREAGLAQDEASSLRQVNMIGEVTGLAKDSLLENTDVVVLPSYTENFSVVVGESLAMGVPVIASTKTPWKRLEDVGCGLWVDNDPPSLAKAITRIVQLPLDDMGHRGRRWMEQEFSWSGTAQRMVRCYAELLSQKIDGIS